MDEPIRIQIRLYPGRHDELIRWLAQFDDGPYGAKAQAVIDALERGIGVAPVGPVAGVDLDLGQIRTVVEAGVQSGVAKALAGLNIQAGEPDEDDEVDELLDGLGSRLIVE